MNLFSHTINMLYQYCNACYLSKERKHDKWATLMKRATVVTNYDQTRESRCGACTSFSKLRIIFCIEWVTYPGKSKQRSFGRSELRWRRNLASSNFLKPRSVTANRRRESTIFQKRNWQLLKPWRIWALIPWTAALVHPRQGKWNVYASSLRRCATLRSVQSHAPIPRTLNWRGRR